MNLTNQQLIDMARDIRRLLTRPSEMVDVRQLTTAMSCFVTEFLNIYGERGEGEPKQ